MQVELQAVWCVSAVLTVLRLPPSPKQRALRCPRALREERQGQGQAECRQGHLLERLLERLLEHLPAVLSRRDSQQAASVL